MKQDIDNALKVLKEGGIILYPTDTIWGIGCDATNPDAVAKIYKLKQRSDSKSMLSLVCSDRMLQQFVKEVPETAWQLIDVAVNPLTIIYDSPTGIASNLVADDGSAGFRITDERFSRELIARFKKPIVSTSANISGRKSPSTFSEISKEIIENVDYVVGYGQQSVASRPSNIIKVSNSGVIKVIR